MKMKFTNEGLYLREQRLARKLTQKELSETLGVNVQFVSNWERGLCRIPTHKLKKAFKVLALNKQTITDLMTEDYRLYAIKFVERI